MVAPAAGRRLAVLIPARDEALRLPKALRELVVALEPSPWTIVTVLVVENGSRDDTGAVAKRTGSELGLPVTAQSIPVNGKASAVCAGLVALAEEQVAVDWILVADADGATDPRVLAKLEPSSGELWVGSRHISGAEIIRPHGFSPVREVMSGGMRLLVRALFRLPVADTQCGFKLVPVTAARALGMSVQSRSWAFDVELLELARRAGLRLVEFPVTWTDVEGSKVSPVQAAIESLIDLLAMRRRLGRTRAVSTASRANPGSSTDPNAQPDRASPS